MKEVEDIANFQLLRDRVQQVPLITVLGVVVLQPFET
jgi:hypothetical protein